MILSYQKEESLTRASSFFYFRVINTPCYGKGMHNMRIAKRMLTKSAISLAAAVASTIGVRLTNAIWDKCTCEKTCKQTKQASTE